MSVEQVLAFPSEALEPLKKNFLGGVCSGFGPANEALGEILGSDLQFLPRPFAETNTSFRQLIPYVALLAAADDGEEKVFCYRRSAKGGEGRLHGKRSLGIGGHINPCDGATGWPAVVKGIERELVEEVGFCPPRAVEWFQQPFAVIADDRDDVGRVHCGLVYLLKVEPEKIVCEDLSLAAPEWVPLSSLKDLRHEFEGWSQLVIDELKI
jgi:predicted NUDIX family phosphoesterase